MRTGNILTRRRACRSMSTASPKPSWRNFSGVIADNKESAAVGAHSSAILLCASGALFFFGQIIGEFTSYKSAISVIDEKLNSDEKLKNEKEQRLKNQQITYEKLKNEEEQRLKDQQITYEKLKKKKEQRLKDQQITYEKLKNAEHRLKKGNLW